MEVAVRIEAKAEAIPLALVVQSLNILSLDASTLEERIQATLQENPLLEASSSYTTNEARDYLFAQTRQRNSLYDDLHQQLGCLRIPKRLELLAGMLIDCLNEDGYLTEDLAQLADEWQVSVSLLEKALGVVQSLEPTGVGSRNLSECLRLQLLEIEPRNELAIDIVTNHLEDLARKTFSFENYADDELAEAIELIQALSPRPCANCGEEEIQYIVPDIRVYKDDEGALCAELINQPTVPMLSPLYHEYLKASSDADRQYVLNQVETARNFIHSLQMRANTLALIAQSLISAQADYFLVGPEAQKAVSLSALAEMIKVNVSTVSRAVAGKYVEFNGKVIPLRDMFNGNGNGTYSRAAITHRIQTMLKAEPTLSDSKIAARLQEQGIQISRRTVNKYRNLKK